MDKQNIQDTRLYSEIKSAYNKLNIEYDDEKLCKTTRKYLNEHSIYHQIYDDYIHRQDKFTFCEEHKELLKYLEPLNILDYFAI